MARKPNMNISEAARKAGTFFSSTNQPDPSKVGRKPNAIKAYVTENDLSSQDIATAIRALAVMTPDQLSDVAADKAAPVLIIGFARAMMIEIKKGGLQNIETLLTRTFGKPVETIKQEIDMHGEIVTLTRAEKEAKIKALQSAAKPRKATNGSSPKTD